ncbi:MAG: hypothetical protein DI539_02450 [Flavobacterium psychrophilum]|nr:MAG: hypothetical protein DI539_02450 [Flavobacterium psychrophilum]
MKKILGLAIALFCLTACSGDDGPKKDTVSLDQLAKRWYYKATKIGNSSETYQHKPCGKDYLEFTLPNITKELHWTDCQQDPEISTGTYTVDADDNEITTVIDNETITYTIKKLNSKEFEAETSIANAKVTFVFTSVP